MTKKTVVGSDVNNQAMGVNRYPVRQFVCEHIDPFNGVLCGKVFNERSNLKVTCLFLPHSSS